MGGLVVSWVTLVGTRPEGAQLVARHITMATMVSEGLQIYVWLRTMAVYLRGLLSC